MGSRIRIFDHFMKPLVEIESATTPRAWVLNGYGRCDFSISTSDPKCIEKNFQYGNLVFIEHIPSTDASGNVNGRLPDWVGIILTPREWDYGVLHVTAYSAESILAFRSMPYMDIKGTPLSMFTQLINLSHENANNITIKLNNLDDVSFTYSDALRTNAFDHIQKLIKDCGMDWSITGSVNELGNLELLANLYNRKGIDTNMVLNNNNVELQSPLLTEQGTPSNHIFGYSQAQTASSRVSTVIKDEASISDYGSLQMNQVYIGRTDLGSVVNATQSRIDKRSRPVKLIKRTALDKGTTFDFLDTGNRANIKETTVGFNPQGGFGFESKVKIISMDYNDLSNKVSLNVEVE